jgi:CHASE2 domain-containing sensor protein
MSGGIVRQRAIGLIAVGLLATAGGLVARAAGTLGWLERSSVDARFSLRGQQRPSSDVVVVGIDNDSLGRLPRFPFSRRLDARVLANLHAAGARLVVYDVSFDRPTTTAADLSLFEAAQRAAPVVFATSLISASGETEVLGGNSNLRSIGDQAAAADLEPDPDGVIRHTLDSVSGLPTVAAAVARRLGIGQSRVRRLREGWIDFPGPPGTQHTLSFATVLSDRFDPAEVRGKVVVVGATAPVLQDLHSTAAGSPMAGPEVQADAISTVLSDFPLRSPPGLVTVLSILALAFLVPLVGLRWGTLGNCLVGLGALCLWSLATQIAFDSGVMLEYTAPLAALVIGTGGTAMLGMWTDGRERRWLRMMFAADSGGIVEQVLTEPSKGALEPTAIIAGYKIEEIRGRGGMGIVYRASQLALGRPVAIKLIATEHAEDPTFRERFISESRIAASIEHANVIPVYEAGEDDGLLFIAMRLVDGLDLAELLACNGPLEPERAIHMVAQVGGALDAAHARGLIHRDVKPANVLVTVDRPEHAYLTDFGVAVKVGAMSRVTKVGQWVGTLDYLAPEQIRGDALSASADIYALSGLLYHCLTGETPYPRDSEAATMWAHVSAAPPTVSRRRPDLPQELDGVIARGLAKDPAERFLTGAELAAACARALGVTLPEDAPPPAVSSPLHPGRDQSTPTLLSE